jgi:hypothetical protein
MPLPAWEEREGDADRHQDPGEHVAEVDASGQERQQDEGQHA